ncbi:MAG: AMP-dependent synthetase, partial [Nitrospirota bacterium]|nr:AMP-dependent synthetase [Nitrospirota bacterium]
MDPSAPFNLATYCLAANLDARPERAAIVFIDTDGGESSLTFAQFGHRMGKLVAVLRAMGLERGD